jgi:hypothetical protein
MKKNYIILILLMVISITTFSQIPNGSFEDWTTFDSYEEPVSWASLNSLTSEYGVFTCEKGTPGNPGNYFLKLTSKDLMSIAVLQGYAICGSLDISGEDETIKGFSFTDRPANLTGKWQHMIYGSSQGMVAVQLTKWDEETQSQIIIASLEYTLTDMAMSWTDFSLPLTYLDSRTPDTCLIAFISSGDDPTLNDYLYVDNVAFQGNVVGIDEASMQTIQVYPNPASNQISVEHQFPIDGNSSIMITNILGELLYSEPVTSSKQTIQVDHFENGIYFVTIKSKEGNITQKVIINR